ncbi:diacylglyceryl transferase [Tamlana haliotis]|uniref:Diacylglyceryl transferase n=1 Tax=Pseudotamlana haliotis TaxID=2614804 RepID=A0A6N6MEG3_9FLAO|nr:diacylglyceryl transferase [Tamlana haliotis]
MEKLKTRWDIEHNWEIIVILIVFSVTGSTASYIGKPILQHLSITTETLGVFGYWVVRILLLFVMYQFMLVFFGWLFGQFKFFWNFEKKMLRRIGLRRFVD